MVRLSDIPDIESMSENKPPEGWYNIKVDERSEVKTGKTSGKSFASLWYVITSGTYKGRILFDSKSFQSSSIQYLKPLLQVIDKPDDYEIIIDASGDITIPIEEFVGHEFQVRLAYWKNKITGELDPKIVAYKKLDERPDIGEEEVPF